MYFVREEARSHSDAQREQRLNSQIVGAEISAILKLEALEKLGTGRMVLIGMKGRIRRAGLYRLIEALESLDQDP